MKEYEYFPYLVTGPYLENESDRTKVISWIRKYDKNIKMIFPDKLSDKKSFPEIRFLSDFLLKKPDRFEYVLSRICVHHINVHISGASIFELGQFHNTMSQSRTTIFHPVFKNNFMNMNERYQVSEYIKRIYSGSIKGYWANRNGWYPDAFWSGNNSLFKQLSKIIYRSKNKNFYFRLRRYNNSNKIKFNYLTNKSSDDSIRIPMKHLYFLFSIFAFKNIETIKNYEVLRELLDLEKEFKEFIFSEFSTKSKSRNETNLFFLFSKSRTNWSHLICSFMWMFFYQYKRQIFALDYLKIIEKKANQMSKYLELIKYDLDNDIKKDPYFNFKINERKIKTYSKTIYGDDWKIKMKSINKKLIENNIVSENSFAYSKERGYLDIVEVHNVSKKFNFIKIDLSNFFESIKENRDKFNVSESEISEINENEFLQGTINAPIISNIFMKEIDEEFVSKLKGVNYSRYSDDILFTWDFNEDWHKKIWNLINDIFKRYGLVINKSKVLEGNHEDVFKYIGLIYRKQAWWISNKFSKKLVRWSKDPERYGLSLKYVINFVNQLNERGIMYRFDKILNKL